MSQGKNLVLEIIHGVRALTHTQTTKKNTFLTHAHERSHFCCCVSPGRRSADHWAKDSDLSAGYILVPEIVTDVIGKNVDWSARSNQDVSFGLFLCAHWLPAGLVRPPPTVNRFSPAYTSCPISTHQVTHTRIHTTILAVWEASVKCQMKKPRFYFRSFSRFPLSPNPPISTCRKTV